MSICCMFHAIWNDLMHHIIFFKFIIKKIISDITTFFITFFVTVVESLYILEKK